MRVAGAISFLFFAFATGATGQGDSLRAKMDWKGQLSVLALFGPDNELDWYTGGRYLPEVNWEQGLGKGRNLDVEVSANIFWYGGLSAL